MLIAELKVWISGVRSVIVPSCQTKACKSPEAVPLPPTTCPRLLMALALLPIEGPPNVPRSNIVPSCQRKARDRSEEHTSELQSHSDLVCRLLLEKKKKK